MCQSTLWMRCTYAGLALRGILCKILYPKDPFCQEIHPLYQYTEFIILYPRGQRYTLGITSAGEYRRRILEKLPMLCR